MSDSSQPHGLQPTRLLCPWDSPGKSTGVGCHCLLQFPALAGRFLTTFEKMLGFKTERALEAVPFNFLTSCVHAKLLQWCLTHCEPMDCSPPGSSMLGIHQARIQEILGNTGLPLPSPGDLPDPGIKPVSLMSPALAVGFFTTSAPVKPSDISRTGKNLICSFLKGVTC